MFHCVPKTPLLSIMKPLHSEGNGCFFRSLLKEVKKVNNSSESVAEVYLHYGCYKEFINTLITLRRLNLG